MREGREAATRRSYPSRSHAPGGVSLFTLAEQPGLLDAAFGLEGLDVVDMLQRQPDVVQPVEQAMPSEGIDFEGKHLATVRIGNGLCAKVDHQSESWKGGDVVKQPIDL